MKRTLMIISGLLLIVVACSRKMTPTATKTEHSQPLSEEATIAAGKTLYENRCGTCHGLKKADRWSVTEWEHILQSMAPKAKLTDIEKGQVTAYVNANAKK